MNDKQVLGNVNIARQLYAFWRGAILKKQFIEQIENNLLRNNVFFYLPQQELITNRNSSCSK